MGQMLDLVQLDLEFERRSWLARFMSCQTAEVLLLLLLLLLAGIHALHLNRDLDAANS